MVLRGTRRRRCERLMRKVRLVDVVFCITNGWRNLWLYDRNKKSSVFNAFIGEV